MPGEGRHLTVGKYHHIFGGGGACIYFDLRVRTDSDYGLHVDILASSYSTKFQKAMRSLPRDWEP